MRSSAAPFQPGGDPSAAVGRAHDGAFRAPNLAACRVEQPDRGFTSLFGREFAHDYALVVHQKEAPGADFGRRGRRRLRLNTRWCEVMGDYAAHESGSECKSQVQLFHGWNSPWRMIARRTRPGNPGQRFHDSFFESVASV